MTTSSENDLDVRKCAAAAAACACFNFRKASRAVTQYFDEMLQPTGLRSTQLVVLIAAAVHEMRGVASLARELVMDRSTLTRNLRPLINQGYLKLKLGTDRRTRLVELTPKGKQALRDAIPVWEQAQSRFVSQLGDERWATLLGLLNDSVNVAWNQTLP